MTVGIKTTEFWSVILVYAAIFFNAWFKLGIDETLLIGITGMSTAYTLGRQNLKAKVETKEEVK